MLLFLLFVIAVRITIKYIFFLSFYLSLIDFNKILINLNTTFNVFENDIRFNFRNEIVVAHAPRTVFVTNLIVPRLSHDFMSILSRSTFMSLFTQPRTRPIQ